MNTSTKNVDEYIAAYPLEIQQILIEVRNRIRSISIDAVESIAYAMPAYKLNGKVLIYFAAYKNHLGIYSTPNTHTAFKKELLEYKQGKGSAQFPYSNPIPFDLIEKMIDFKIKEIKLNLKK